MKWTREAVSGAMIAIPAALLWRSFLKSQPQESSSSKPLPPTMAFVLAGGRCTTLAQAAKLMWRNRCRRLLVLDDSGEVMGVVTDQDLLRVSGTPEQKVRELTVSEIITN